MCVVKHRLNLPTDDSDGFRAVLSVLHCSSWLGYLNIRVRVPFTNTERNVKPCLTSPSMVSTCCVHTPGTMPPSWNWEAQPGPDFDRCCLLASCPMCSGHPSRIPLLEMALRWTSKLWRSASVHPLSPLKSWWNLYTRHFLNRKRI